MSEAPQFAYWARSFADSDYPASNGSRHRLEYLHVAIAKRAVAVAVVVAAAEVEYVDRYLCEKRNWKNYFIVIPRHEFSTRFFFAETRTYQTT